MLFTIVRVMLGLLGAWMALGFVAAVILAVDGEWGLALSTTLTAIIGIWLVRVGINGTFSGNPPSDGPAPPSHDELTPEEIPRGLAD